MNAKRKPNPRIIVNFTNNPGCFDGSLEGIVIISLENTLSNDYDRHFFRLLSRSFSFCFCVFP